MTPKYLRTKDAAAYLGLAPGTLDKLRRTEHGPPYRKYGARAVAYSVEELTAWADARTRRSTRVFPEAPHPATA
jgi:predicted DNA-binding transcriptional regulator AlpA